jgi:hypothetical protein
VVGIVANEDLSLSLSLSLSLFQNLTTPLSPPMKKLLEKKKIIFHTKMYFKKKLKGPCKPP